MRHAIWFWQLSGLMTDETMWNVILHEIMVLSWQSLNRQRKSFLKVLIYLKQYQFNMYVVDLDEAKNKKGTYRNENSYSRLHLGEKFSMYAGTGLFYICTVHFSPIYIGKQVLPVLNLPRHNWKQMLLISNQYWNLKRVLKSHSSY